jgi:hypothetical protein
LRRKIVGLFFQNEYGKIIRLRGQALDERTNIQNLAGDAMKICSVRGVERFDGTRMTPMMWISAD